MDYFVRRLLGRARREYLKRHPRPEPEPFKAVVDLSGQAASDLIRKKLAGPDPVMIARLGAVESMALANYRAMHRDVSVFRKVSDYVRGDAPPPWWEEGHIHAMRENAGFFTPHPTALDWFAELMIDDMPLVDVLGSWLREEQLFAAELKNAVKVRLEDLEPYYHRDPWSEALGGKTVLVVHPFAETIRSQYARRASLFPDPRVLPAFELKVLAAVQTIAGGPSLFRTWFDALESMKDQIASTKFDVAILGCGAYGFPLAAHVKRLGRKAVHLGGATQILFGIRGRRWDSHEIISGFYNEHWVRPQATETPSGYRKVEDGAYW